MFPPLCPTIAQAFPGGVRVASRPQDPLYTKRFPAVSLNPQACPGGLRVLEGSSLIQELGVGEMRAYCGGAAPPAGEQLAVRGMQVRRGVGVRSRCGCSKAAKGVNRAGVG